MPVKASNHIKKNTEIAKLKPAPVVKPQSLAIPKPDLSEGASIANASPKRIGGRKSRYMSDMLTSD